jgi:hypothetical protein
MTKRQDQTPASARIDDLRRKIRREGAEEAFAALRAVCNDKSAPAPARATAATSIFRAAGLFDRYEGDASEKPLSEKTPAELAAMLESIERDAKRAQAVIDAGGDDSFFD